MALEPATPQQVAYLSYMGVKGTKMMFKDKASAHIESLKQRVHDSPPESELKRRHSDWMRDRFRMYPDLFESELRLFLDEGLPSSLHLWIGARMKGSSAKLIKAQIKQVMKSLSRENADWWMEDEYHQLFYERLSQLFPNTVDGKFSEPKTSSRTKSLLGGGCFGVFALGVIGVTGLITCWP